MSRSRPGSPQFRKPSPNLLPLRSRSASLSSVGILPNITLLPTNIPITIGCLYDATNDTFPDKLDINKSLIFSSVLREKMEGIWITAEQYDFESILNTIGITNEMALNTLLVPPSTQCIRSFINYDFTMTKNTRFLHFLYIHQEVSLLKDQNKVRGSLPTMRTGIAATHIVSSIKKGIQLLAIIEFDGDNHMQCDESLVKFCRELTTNPKSLDPITHDSIFQKIKPVIIFSNINDLTNMNSLDKIFKQISNIRRQNVSYQPVSVTVTPIKHYYPMDPIVKHVYVPLPVQIEKSLTMCFLDLSRKIADLKKCLNSSVKPQTRIEIENVTKDYNKILSDTRIMITTYRSGKINSQISSLRNVETQFYSSLKEKIHKIIVATQNQAVTFTEQRTRSLTSVNQTTAKDVDNSKKQYAIDSIDPERKSITSNICQNDFKQDDSVLSSKKILHDNQNMMPSTYEGLYFDCISRCNVGSETRQLRVDAKMIPDIKESTRKNMPMKATVNILPLKSDPKKTENKQDSILRPSFRLIPSSPNILPTYHPSLRSVVKNRSHESRLQPEIHFVDNLNDFPRTTPSTVADHSKISRSRSTSSSRDAFVSSKRLKPIETKILISDSSNSIAKELQNKSQPLTDSRYVNILLLGESGVGKSTFINALANYSRFTTIEQANETKPLVVIPVSFLTTIRHSFEEIRITYGEDVNENHHHPGQSVTQPCRSYIFSYTENIQLRIIDTPGMGDTRGYEQDNKNLEHIIQFITGLSHLDGICILLKPNESRMNILIRSYFRRLLTFLGENAARNIIFCFTNARSTFFTPGNTGPLVQKMVEDLSIKHLVYNKHNTFCFDSESFRYLMAKQNGVLFDSDETEEYRKSWNNSVKRCHEFLLHVCHKTRSLYQKDWRSIEHLQYTIHKITGPALESIRHNYRNLILQEQTPTKQQILQVPKSLPVPSTLCNSCPNLLNNYAGIWIVKNEFHESLKPCAECLHTRSEYITILYVCQYSCVNDSVDVSSETLKRNIQHLTELVVALGQVISKLNIANSIIQYFKRMIKEEKFVVDHCSRDSICLNGSLLDKMIKVAQNFCFTECKHREILNEEDALQRGYRLVEKLESIDLVQQQINAINKTLEQAMIAHEKHID